MHIFGEGIRRARKRHVCDACGKGILPKRKYYWQTSNFDNHMGTFKAHILCLEIYEILNAGVWDVEDRYPIYDFCKMDVVVVQHRAASTAQQALVEYNKSMEGK